MSRLTRWALIGMLALIWGSTWLAIKVGLDDLPPFLGAALRFLLAGAILFIVSRARRIAPLRSRKGHLALIGLGVVNFWISYGVVYWGEQILSSGLTAVLFATNPLFTLLVAHAILPSERINFRKFMGVVVGFLGIVFIFRTDLGFDDPRGPLAAAILLISPLASAAGAVAIKRWGAHVHPYNLTTFPMLYGAVLLGATSLIFEDIGSARWTPTAIGSVVYLAVAGSAVAFVTYYTLLREVPVTTLNLISYIFPVVALALGYLVLGEVLEPLALIGAATILAGIAIATWRRRAARPTIQLQ